MDNVAECIPDEVMTEYHKIGTNFPPIDNLKPFVTVADILQCNNKNLAPTTITFFDVFIVHDWLTHGSSVVARQIQCLSVN